LIAQIRVPGVGHEFFSTVYRGKVLQRSRDKRSVKKLFKPFDKKTSVDLWQGHSI